MATYVNGRLLREALLRNGYSDRDFTRITGIGQTVLRTMLFKNEASPSLAIADVLACARATGLSLDDLLTEPLPEPSSHLEDDAVLLARVLIAIKRRQPVQHIAATLGWELPHAHAVIADMKARLERLGLEVTLYPGVAITPIGSGLHDVIAELNKRRDTQDGLHHGAARVLFKIMNGNLSTREIPNDTAVQIGALSNRGAITLGPSGPDRFALSDELRFALLEEPTPDSAERPTKRLARSR